MFLGELFVCVFVCVQNSFSIFLIFFSHGEGGGGVLGLQGLIKGRSD